MVQLIFFIIFMFGSVIYIVLDIIKKITWIYRFAFLWSLLSFQEKFELCCGGYFSLSLIFGTSIHVDEILTIMQIRYFHTWLRYDQCERVTNNENMLRLVY